MVILLFVHPPLRLRKENKIETKIYKKTVSVLLSLILILTIAFLSSAHEMYYEGTSSGIVPVVLEWYPTTNGDRYIRINGDKINGSGNYSNYATQYSYAKSAWNNVGGVVTVVDSAFSSSNVDVAVATEDYWKELVGWYNINITLGRARRTSTGGMVVQDLASAKMSTRKINYASVFLTPYSDNFSSNTMIRYVIVHEVGHALCLGHPNDTYYIVNDASVMRTYVNNATYYSPQQHDINDIISKYG